jgi:hypothetical protein
MRKTAISPPPTNWQDKKAASLGETISSHPSDFNQHLFNGSDYFIGCNHVHARDGKGTDSVTAISTRHIFDD